MKLRIKNEEILAAMVRIRAAAVILVAILLLLEFSVRIMGFVDFPIYVADNRIGYIPKANQRGSFANRNEWHFNSLHMGADEFVPGPYGNLLLVGDSIVFGGNDYKLGERLGPQLESRLRGVRVWPISAGSWALRNELIWLHDNETLASQVDHILIILNSGDFGEASSWSCNLTHPTKRPAFGLMYLFEKYVYTWRPCDGRVPTGLLVPTGDLRRELEAFLRTQSKKVTFVLYSTKAEQFEPATRQRAIDYQIDFLTKAGAKNILAISQDKRWSTEHYKDAIHPSAAGTEVLAEIIRDHIDNASFGPNFSRKQIP